MSLFNLTDGLVKRLEELEKTAELYKGNKTFPSGNFSAMTQNSSSVF